MESEPGVNPDSTPLQLPPRSPARLSPTVSGAPAPRVGTQLQGLCWKARRLSRLSPRAAAVWPPRRSRRGARPNVSKRTATCQSRSPEPRGEGAQLCTSRPQLHASLPPCPGSRCLAHRSIHLPPSRGLGQSWGHSRGASGRQPPSGRGSVCSRPGSGVRRRPAVCGVRCAVAGFGHHGSGSAEQRAGKAGPQGFPVRVALPPGPSLLAAGEQMPGMTRIPLAGPAGRTDGRGGGPRSVHAAGRRAAPLAPTRAQARERPGTPDPRPRTSLLG